MVTMETMTVRKIFTSVLAIYFKVLSICKCFIAIKLQEKKLSMIEIFKLFVSDHLKPENRLHKMLAIDPLVYLVQ